MMTLLGISKSYTFVFSRLSRTARSFVKLNVNCSTGRPCTLFSVSFHTYSSQKLSNRMAESASKLKQQYFDYFLVLDFEATCKEKNEEIVPQEIIEFPVLKINARTLETETTFHQYVQPKVHQQLTPFCTKLTGIMQDMVDGQPHIEEVLGKFHKWMEENHLLDPNVKSVFVTCGNWDLKIMLPSQAEYFKLNTASYFNKWLDIKKAYAEVKSKYPKGMMPMLEGLRLKHQGRHHSGIDDCKNIGNILKELLRRGYVAKVTGSRE